MTGDAPQPGETPRNESEPWAYGDPNTAWWRVEQERDRAEALADAAASRPRHPRRRASDPTPASDRVRPPAADTELAFAPEALDAHAAGAQDAARELAPAAAEKPAAAEQPAAAEKAAAEEPAVAEKPAAAEKAAAEEPAAAKVEAEQEATIESIESKAARKAVDDADAVAAVTVALPVVERDHDRRSKERYNPTPEEGYAVSKADESPKKEFPDLTGDASPGDPDVMLLPEPNRSNRPTVPVAELMAGRPGKQADRVPEQAHTPRMSPAAEQRLANSTFWLSEEERTSGEAPVSEARQRLADEPGRGRPPAQKPRSPRSPLPGLLGLVALALVAAFFSWVSAEPFWLAVGHGDQGVATVGQCTGSGVTQRCVGSFTAADNSFAVQEVALLGVDPEARNAGAVAQARMVSASSDQAYVGDTGWLVHLRWTLGFILVVMCGYGIAGLTGARLLDTPQARRGAVLMSLAGPILLLMGFLAAAY